MPLNQYAFAFLLFLFFFLSFRTTLPTMAPFCIQKIKEWVWFNIQMSGWGQCRVWCMPLSHPTRLPGPYFLHHPLVSWSILIFLWINTCISNSRSDLPNFKTAFTRRSTHSSFKQVGNFIFLALSFIFLWIVRPTCTAHYLKGWPLFRHVKKPWLTNSPFTSSPLFRIWKFLGWRLWSWIYAQIHPSALLIL